MFDKLSFIEDRFKDLETKISDPAVIADQEQWRKYCKEHSGNSEHGKAKIKNVCRIKKNK